MDATREFRLKQWLRHSTVLWPGVARVKIIHREVAFTASILSTGEVLTYLENLLHDAVVKMNTSTLGVTASMFKPEDSKCNSYALVT